MKRFLKIFAICFSGLIGVFGATYGGLTLFGYFDEPTIYPNDIDFDVNKEGYIFTNSDNNEIFASFNPNDQGFYVTITTQTENVTKKEIQLSLDGVDAGEGNLGNGKISDSVIIIPEKVTIGERFLVEPAKSNQTLGFGNNKVELEWILGGHSTIRAKSLDNLALTSQTLKVHIDVPVYDIRTYAVATETGAQESDEFSIGTNFKIEAEFSPSNSKYYYAMDGKDGYSEVLKNIYVDENSEQRNDIFKRISEENLSQNIFTALKETTLTKANFTAYCFENSYLQYNAESFLTGVNTEDDVYKSIRDDLITGDSNNFAKYNTALLDFKKITDLSYTMTNSLSESYNVNNIFTWFVNHNQNSPLSKNLNIQFTSLYSNLDLQSETQKLGIQILKYDNENYVYDKNIKPYQYGDVKYLAYYFIKNGDNYITYEDYLLLEDEELSNIQVSFISESDYNALNYDDKLKYTEIIFDEETYNNLETNIKNVFTGFYFPLINKSNIDLSYWQFSFELAKNYKVRFKYFSTDSEIVIADKHIDLNIQSIVSGEIDFTSVNPVNLKINYIKEENSYTGSILEYDISKYNQASNISIPTNNQYTTVRYFVFVENGVLEDGDDLTNYIECVKTNNTRDFGNTIVYLYEIQNGILKFKTENIENIKNVTFYGCFATVKTDLNGTIIFNNNSYLFDQESRRNIQITIKDTLKEIDIEASIDEILEDVDYFMTKTGEQDQISFLQNKQNVITIKISAIDENQTNLLKNEIENGNIKINALYNETNVTDQIISISYVEQDGDIIYQISTKLLTGQDQKFVLKVNYLINNTSYDVELNGVSNLEVFSGLATQVHFGKETTTDSGEGIVTTTYGQIIKEQKDKNNAIQITKVFEESNGETNINISYKLVDELGNEILSETEIKSFLFDDKGNLQFTFEDKYGRTVDSGNYTLETSDNEIIIITKDNNFNFVKSGTCELKLIIDNETKDSLLLTYDENSAEIDNISVNSQDGLKVVYENNPDDPHDFTKTIETSFVGNKDNVIYFEKGAAVENGLLKLSYRQPNDEDFDIFDFSSKIKYSFETDLDSDLQEMLSVNFGENHEIVSLKINHDFYSSARIRIRANIEILNLEQVIEIHIQPNVNINYDVNYAFNDAESVTDGINTYFGVYGDTSIEITLAVSYEIETANYVLYDQAKTPLDVVDKNFVYTYEFNQENNYKTIQLRISDNTEETQNKYRFNLSLYYNINPNIKVNNIYPVNINGDNEINLFTTNENKNAIEVTKVSDNDIIDYTYLTVMAEIVNGVYVDINSEEASFTYANNVLKLKNTAEKVKKYKLVLGSNLNSDLTYVNFKKGCSVIEIEDVSYYYVEIEVLPFIQLDLNSNAFITYNGQKYLKLISDTEYEFTSLTDYFISDDDWTITVEGIEQELHSTVYDINNNKIIVSEIYDIQGLTEKYYLQVKAEKDSKIHNLNVPILFLPVDFPYLSQELLANSDINDYYNLLSVLWLQQNQALVDIEITAGQSIDLASIFNFDLNNFSYTVVNEDNTNNKYADVEIQEINDGGQQVFNYVLHTELVDSDKIVYVIARRKKLIGNSSANVIAIPARLKIRNGLSLQTYYPYGGDAEYIVLHNNSKVIDLKEILSSTIPNRSSNFTRFEIVNKNSNNNDIIISNNKYSLSYVFEVQDGSLSNDLYASINGSVLTLNKVSEKDYSVVVTINVVNSNNVIVANKAYKFTIINEKVFNLTSEQDAFEIEENNDLNISELFSLEEEVNGSVVQDANEKLKFYVANGQEVVKAILKDGIWTISAGETVVDINAQLIAYTEYGELKTYNLVVKSNKKIVVEDIKSGEESLINIKVDGEDQEIVNVELLEITNGTIENNIAKFTDEFGNVSSINVFKDQDGYKINSSPFSEDVMLTIRITFENNGNTWVWEGVVKCKKQLSSLASKLENVVSETINAGTSKDYADTSALFEGEKQYYYLKIEAIQNSQLVNINGSTVRFKSSANDGVVILKFTYTHNNYSYSGLELDFNVVAYAKFQVKANISYTINYPAGVQKEYLPSGSTISLLEKNIFDQQRFVPENYDTSKVISYNIIKNEGVTVTVGQSIGLELQTGYNIGNVTIEICFDGDAIAYYYIEVRKQWSDIITSNLINIDGSTNLETNPEIYLDNQNYENKKVLDVADYDKAKNKDLIKKLVLGYNETENIFVGKSTFNYYVDKSYQPPLDASKLVFSDKIIETEDINSSLIEITISFNGVTICSYYALFEFEVKFNSSSYSIIAGEKNNVKDMFGISCNENYSISLLQTDNSINYTIYQLNGGEYVDVSSKYKGRNCITFENNNVNPEIAGWGAPNSGLKFVYTVCVSYGDKFKYQQDVETYIDPVYTVEHDGSLKVTDDMFRDNIYNFDIATTDLSTSIVKVYIGSSQDNLIVKNSSNWTVVSSNSLVVSDIIKDTSKVNLTVKKSTFGIKETKITFEDSYGYIFDYYISVIPNEVNIPKFNTSSLSAYENETINLLASISNSTLIATNYSETTVTLIRDGYEDIVMKGEDALTAFVLPYVDSTQSGNLNAKIYSADKSESAIIQIPITIMKKYSLSVNEKYLTDGIIYYREGEILYLNDLFYIYDNQTGHRAGERSLIETKSIKLIYNLTDIENIMLIQAKNMIELNNANGFELSSTFFENGISNINLSSYLENAGLSTDASNYNFIVSCLYENDTNYTNTVLFGNSSLEIVFESDNAYHLRMGSSTNKLKENSIMKIWAMDNKNSTIHNINNLQDFGKSESEYYIPFTRLSDFSINTNEYNYYAIANIGDDNMAKQLVKTIDAPEPVTVVDDKVLKVYTTNAGESIDVKLSDDSTIVIDLDGSTYEKSLLLLGKDSTLKLKNDKDYIDGLSINNLSKIKGISGVKLTEIDEVYTEHYTPKITSTLTMDSYPYYQQSQLYFEIQFAGDNGKTFKTSIVLRTIPPIAYIANVDNNIEWGESNILKVAVGNIDVSGNAISFDSWMEKVNVLDENKNPISNLVDLDKTNFVLTYSIKQEDGAKGSVNASGDITLANDFDFESGHITVVINISNKTGVYNIPIGEVIILPRKA